MIEAEVQPNLDKDRDLSRGDVTTTFESATREVTGSRSYSPFGEQAATQSDRLSLGYADPSTWACSTAVPSPERLADLVYGLDRSRWRPSPRCVSVTTSNV